MDVAAAQAIVSKMTYKPGWELLCYPQPEPAGGVVLRFGKDEIDSEINDGTTTRALMLTAALTREQLGAIDKEIFLQFAFDTVAQRELHEVEEWLRYDGRPIKEPHPAKDHRGILGDGASLDTIHPGERVVFYERGPEFEGERTGFQIRQHDPGPSVQD